MYVVTLPFNPYLPNIIVFMSDDKTNHKGQSTEAVQKKKSIFDNPKQRRLFEKMGSLYKVTKPDNADKK